MGLTGRPPLPAPTDLSTTTYDDGSPDVATDLSRRTDKTSFSIPEDGRPVTITTGGKSLEKRHRISSAHKKNSQTSLLIEYFEGEKVNEKGRSVPSVRVKLNPSKSRRTSARKDGHIEITETSTRTRKPSGSKRVVTLPAGGVGDYHADEGVDDRSISSYTSAAEESALGRRAAIEVEIGPGMSDISGTLSSPTHSKLAYANPSEVSSMPPDPFAADSELSTTGATLHEPSKSHLSAPRDMSARDISRERLGAKVIARLKDADPAEGKMKHKSQIRSINYGKEGVADLSSPRRRRKHLDEDHGPSQGSSLLSQKSGRSIDETSVLSGASKSSVSNPRLIQHVEDAIKRLILPELRALQQEQAAARTQRDSYTTNDTISRDGSRRRVSKTSSAPDVKGRPSVIIDDVDAYDQEVDKRRSYAERKDRRTERVYSEEKLRNKGARSKSRDYLKKAALAGAGVAAGAALLSHHESRGSPELTKSLRRQHSGQSSRSVSYSESEHSLNEEALREHDRHDRHDSLPLPFQSDVHSSEVTRGSILSADTERPDSVSQVVSTPIKGTVSISKPDIQHGLSTYQSNHSRGDLGLQEVHELHRTRDSSNLVAGAAGLAAAGVIGSADFHRRGHYQEPSVDEDFDEEYDERPIQPVDQLAAGQYFSSPVTPYEHGKPLSPIQSVASYMTEQQTGQDFHSSPRRRGDPNHRSTLSMSSLSSIHSEEFSGPGRVRAVDSEGEGLATRLSQQDASSPYDYRTPLGGASRKVSAQEDYEQQKATILGRSYPGPEMNRVGDKGSLRSTPIAVESAVASLHDPSILGPSTDNSLDSPTKQAGRLDQSYYDEIDRSPEQAQHHAYVTEEREPMQGSHFAHDRSHLGSASGSQQSLKQGPAALMYSLADHSREHVKMTHSGLPILDDPMPEIVDNDEPLSEVNTNPSIIQGPIGTVPRGAQDPWPFETPEMSKPRSRDDVPGSHHAATATAGIIGAGMGLGLARGLGKKSSASGDQFIAQGENLRTPVSQAPGTPPVKDEGYASAARDAPTPGEDIPSPERRRRAVLFDADVSGGLEGEDEDPKTGARREKYLSGNSHGMPSPIYDSSMGHGMNRIQSKDIVYLMNHLAVRDGARNARDTEILMTLVQSASEMRGEFEVIKEKLDLQETNIIRTTDRNTEKHVKTVIGGPRPLAPTPARRSTDDNEQEELKKSTNVFKRALRGLSGKNSNDLARIEDMLYHILEEVEDIKEFQIQQAGNGYSNRTADQAGEEYPENEQRLPTPQSPSDQMEYASNAAASTGNSQRRLKSYDNRDPAPKRISTVPEADEEEYEEYDGQRTPTQERPQSQFNQAQQFDPDYQPGSPSREYDDQYDHSLPEEHTPPIKRKVFNQEGESEVRRVQFSDENTPTKQETTPGRRHKSAGSWGGKLSRWSETTASSVANKLRGSRNSRHTYIDDSPQEGYDEWEGQQPGEPLQSHPGNTDQGVRNRTHTSDKLHSGFSQEDVVQQQRTPINQDRTQSPLLPSQTGEESIVSRDERNSDIPQHRANRISLDIQHPQPRPGASYGTQLETQARRLAAHTPISDTASITSAGEDYQQGFNGGRAIPDLYSAPYGPGHKPVVTRKAVASDRRAAGGVADDGASTRSFSYGQDYGTFLHGGGRDQSQNRNQSRNSNRSNSGMMAGGNTTRRASSRASDLNEPLVPSTSQGSASAVPPRPAKIKEEHEIPMDRNGSPIGFGATPPQVKNGRYIRASNGASGSLAGPGGVTPRKPTGPRAMGSSSAGTGADRHASDAGSGTLSYPPQSTLIDGEPCLLTMLLR